MGYVRFIHEPYLHSVDGVGVRAGGFFNGEDVPIAPLADFVQNLEGAFPVLEAVRSGSRGLLAADGNVALGLAQLVLAFHFVLFFLLYVPLGGLKQG